MSNIGRVLEFLMARVHKFLFCKTWRPSIWSSLRYTRSSWLDQVKTWRLDLMAWWKFHHASSDLSSPILDQVSPYTRSSLLEQVTWSSVLVKYTWPCVACFTVSSGQCSQMPSMHLRFSSLYHRLGLHHHYSYTKEWMNIICVTKLCYLEFRSENYLDFSFSSINLISRWEYAFVTVNAEFNPILPKWTNSFTANHK